MKLWDCQMAPNPRRARIFIAEKGLDIPRHEINIIAGENVEYVGGTRFSAADITTLCALDFGRAVGLGYPEEHTQTRRWHALVGARPSAKA